MDRSDGLRFSVLGPVRAWQGDEELNLGSPQQRALLGALLLHEGRAITSDALIAAIWGQDPPSRALSTLRTYAYRLRKVLEADRSRPGTVVSVGTGYAMSFPRGSLDAQVFEERYAEAEKARTEGDPARARTLLTQALGLWQGDALDGTVGPYAEAQRDRLGDRRLSALQAKLQLDIELGRATEAVADLTMLSAAHPLRESLSGLLMLALYRCGRQAEALEVFDRTRRLLAEDLGIDPGGELRELHHRILTSDPELLPARPAPGPSPAPQEVPTAGLPPVAQIPADLSDFTGREEEVALLTEVLKSGSGQATTVVSLSGKGGVGKTALAIHVAHLLSEAFPDGQLYIDLCGAGGLPVEPTAALREFLCALSRSDADLPDDLTQRAALFRSLMVNRRMLVILDNAVDDTQVRPLLPGTGGCAVLVTSRAKPAGLPTTRRVDLDVLTPRDAVQLFTRIVGEERVATEPEAVEDAVVLCGFLPLAVRIAASRLVSRPLWTISSLVERLADERRRLSELRLGTMTVEVTFQLGYERLGAEQARAFRLLAIPETTSFSLPAAAAILGLEPLDAEDIVESLVDLGMLDSPTPGRYRFHQLLRLYGRNLAEQSEHPHERRAALFRLLDHLLATQADAVRMLNSRALVSAPAADASLASLASFASAEEAREWIDAEALAMIGLITQLVGVPHSPLSSAADLLFSLGILREDGRHRAELEGAAVAVLDESVRRGHPRGEARAAYTLGWILASTAREEEARPHIERAVTLCRNLCRDEDDRVVLAEALGLLADLPAREG
ncbi:BTAD domain-containing putative transcriptional regulator [Nonomuraea sp. NPDC000554]|uniref:AfsR/SARP family transcriptional regulator n=1 Tax=Nonomuraea sp. NPDC000554 TaxID=3154259 RepID=UPI00333405DC